MNNIVTLPEKDPEAELDYLFDWAAKRNNNGLTNWLKEGELITSHTLVIPDGISIISDYRLFENSAVQIWMTAGTNLVDYTITCKIETNQGRKDTRRIIIPVRLR